MDKMDKMLLFLVCLVSQTFALNVYDGNSQNVTEVPLDIPTEVKSVQLSYNSISNVSSDAFEDLYQVETITINYNLLGSFPNLNVVAGTLDTLELTYNLITFVDGELLNSLEKLTILDLSHNPIKTLPMVSSKLSLVKFKVQNLKLSEPPVIEDKSKLEVLTFGRNNDITKIPHDYFMDMPTLRVKYNIYSIHIYLCV